MKTASFCVFFLLNLMIISMMGYFYLIWLQYSKYHSNKQIIEQHNYIGFDLREQNSQVHILKGHPRFHRTMIERTENFEIDDAYGESEPRTPKPKPIIRATMTPEQMAKEAEKHKIYVVSALRKSKIEGVKKDTNLYGVKYNGEMTKGKPSRKEILCFLKKSFFRSLRDGDEPFIEEGLGRYFPHRDLFEGDRFNSCALVSSAHSTMGSNLGSFIDSHDAVVRFNHAPTHDYTDDVGSKTTLRIINHQIVDKPEFRFWDSNLYKNISLMIWAESNYTASLREFYNSKMFNTMSEYFKRRLMMPQEPLYFLHPKSLWGVWDSLQKFTDMKILTNPPSSGFIGLVLMMHHCNTINAIEFIPSIRMSTRCHYWEDLRNEGCTIGGWHPTYAEKLLMMSLNTASDIETYVKGIVTIPGFSDISC